MILFRFNPWSCSIQSLNQFLVQFNNEENSIFHFDQRSCWNSLQPCCWSASSWTQFCSWFNRTRFCCAQFHFRWFWTKLGIKWLISISMISYFQPSKLESYSRSPWNLNFPPPYRKDISFCCQKSIKMTLESEIGPSPSSEWKSLLRRQLLKMQNCRLI